MTDCQHPTTSMRLDEAGQQIVCECGVRLIDMPDFAGRLMEILRRKVISEDAIHRLTFEAPERESKVDNIVRFPVLERAADTGTENWRPRR